MAARTNKGHPKPEAIEVAREKLLANLPRWLDNGHYDVKEEVF